MDLTFNITWANIMSLTLVNFFAIASPGPALIVQMKQSINGGYKKGLMFAIGVAVGIGLHLLYIFMGLAKVIASYSWLETVVISVAILYFSYLFCGLMRTPRYMMLQDSEEGGKVKEDRPKRSRSSFLLGVFISAINPNAVVFMITIFAPLVDPTWNLFSCFMMLTWLSFCCFAYYALLNTFFSNRRIACYYFKYRFYFDRIIALFFLYLIICFGAKLLPAAWVDPIRFILYF